MKATWRRPALAAIGFLLISTAGCRTVSVPDDWVEVEGRNYFTLKVPPDYREIPVQGEDSYVRMFRSDDVEFHIGYGAYNDPLNYPDKPAYQRTETTIHGRRAYMVTYDSEELYQEKYTRVAAVYVPWIGLFNWSCGFFNYAKLTVWANCVDAAGVEEVKLIFQTIRFK